MNAGHVSVLTPRHSVDVDALSFAGRGSVDGGWDWVIVPDQTLDVAHPGRVSSTTAYTDEAAWHDRAAVETTEIDPEGSIDVRPGSATIWLGTTPAGVVTPTGGRLRGEHRRRPDRGRERCARRSRGGISVTDTIDTEDRRTVATQTLDGSVSLDTDGEERLTGDCRIDDGRWA